MNRLHTIIGVCALGLAALGLSPAAKAQPCTSSAQIFSDGSPPSGYFGVSLHVFGTALLQPGQWYGVTLQNVQTGQYEIYYFQTSNNADCPSIIADELTTRVCGTHTDALYLTEMFPPFKIVINGFRVS